MRLREKAAFSVNGLKHFKNHVTSFFSFKEHVAHEFEPFESKPKAPLGQILHLAPPMAVCHFHVIFMWCPGESICQTHALGRVGTHVATSPGAAVRRAATAAEGAGAEARQATLPAGAVGNSMMTDDRCT